MCRTGERGKVRWRWTKRVAEFSFTSTEFTIFSQHWITFNRHVLIIIMCRNCSRSCVRVNKDYDAPALKELTFWSEKTNNKDKCLVLINIMKKNKERWGDTGVFKVRTNAILYSVIKKRNLWWDDNGTDRIKWGMGHSDGTWELGAWTNNKNNKIIAIANIHWILTKS